MDFWYAITLFGEPELWAIICIILAVSYFVLRYGFWKKSEKHLVYKRFLTLLFVSLFVSLLLAAGLKVVFSVERPCISCVGDVVDCNPYCPLDYSFPSGHAITIFTLFSSLYFVVRRRFTLFLFIVPVLIAVSRLFLGVHTLLDVTVGAMLGIVLTWIVFLVENRYLAYMK